MTAHGIPWEVATSIPEDLRPVWAIALGTYEGGEFNYDSWTWREKTGENAPT